MELNVKFEETSCEFGVEFAETLNVGGGYDEGYEQGKDEAFFYVNNINRTFACANWDGEKVFELNLPNIKGELRYIIDDIKGVKKLKLKGNTANNAININYPFTSTTVEEVDLTEFGDGGLKPSACNGIVYSCGKLKYIYGELDFSEVTGNINVPFTYSFALIEVRFKALTISKALDISPCSALSNDSIQSLVDGYADMTGQTSPTLTVHKTVGGKMTDAQKATLTAKNVTLVY